MAVSISHVSFEHYRSAFGISETKPRISWRFNGSVPDWEQQTYDVEVTRHGSGGLKSFTIDSSESVYVPWPDTALDEAESAAVRVRAHGRSEQQSTPWSDWVTVETGILESTWKGIPPITAGVCESSVDDSLPKRPLHFRKVFDIPSKVASARLYITALGIYEAEINGKIVGDHVLSPGWQSYHFRHAYDTYDVTDLLLNGSSNAIGVTVAEGWYAGRLGFEEGNRNVFGNRIGVLSLLVVTLENGEQIKIPTDNSWQASKGPTVSAEIYDGEIYDARIAADIEGWSTAQFNGSSWHFTKELPEPKGKLVPPSQPPMRRIQEVKPQRIFKSPSGKTLIDFGQNLVGRLRVRVDGPSGTNITLRHAEVLEEGELALRPLRNAMARDTILLNGSPLTWEPKFTFHGFRYAQIDGWPEAHTPLNGDSVVAIVVHTDMEQTGWFESSHELLNQFHSNVRWSMKGNFLSIPMDCPQRDERLGWTGDAHAFGPTSNYLYNTAGFWRDWHKDVFSEMSRDGSMVPPNYVPILPRDDWNRGTSVWSDVVVGNPWNVYQSFGDLELLQEHLPQARGWLDVGLLRNEVGLWDRRTFQWGDWLDPKAPSANPHGATTHPHLVSDAYLVRMTEILSQISGALGEDSLADKYAADHARLRTEFQKAWVTADGGALANRTQTAYALALAFDLLTEQDHRENARHNLTDIIEKNDYLVGTGFAGTPVLGTALRQINESEAFYRMLLQTKVPSWLYQVIQGGTTTWERWDSLFPDGSVNPGEMTSFNHYAFGSVADWIHRTIGGLSPATPGWKRISVKPIPGGGLTHASARYISPYGEVSSKWWIDEGGFHLEVGVPPNSQAEVTLPGEDVATIVGSGTHSFQQAI